MPSFGHPVTSHLREESKHMGKLSPTQRTMSWLREQGYTVGTVERYIHPGSFVGHGHRRDLFGCIDLIAIRPGRVLAVQSTGTDWAGHWQKLTVGGGRDGVARWLETGQPMILIGWRKLKAGWQPRVHWFAEEDLVEGSDSRRHRRESEWVSPVPPIPPAFEILKTTK